LLAITSLLHDKSINFPFINNKNEWEQHSVYFYERSPAGRGLDFTDTEDIKTDFLRYVVDYHFQNPIADIRKHPLPPLEELVEGATLQLAAGLKGGCEPCKDINRALREANNTNEWFPNNTGPCNQDLIVNEHWGAGGAMTPRRVQDPEGAKTILVSYKTTAGVAAAISMHHFKIVCPADPPAGSKWTWTQH
jgi:hypothetical protein